MTRPPLLAVTLALCCVLAGCNAFAPGATPDSSDPPTVTPADVPRAGSDRIAPGLTGERLVDEMALLDAHRAVLANRTVTVEQFSRATAENGTALYEQRIENRYAADRSHVNAVGRNVQTGYGSVVDLWANASAGVYRYGGSDDPHYRLQDFGVQLDPAERLRYELGVGDQTPVPVETRSLGERDGYERFQVTLRTDIYQTNGPDTDPTTFVVDERGFISEIRNQRRGSLSYDGGFVEEATVDVVVRYGMGGDPVERPAWVADAREAIANREYLAPGVTSDSVVDVAALVDAHRQVVANTSVTYDRERRVQRNGTRTALERASRWRSADAERYHADDYRVDDGETTREEYWTNGSASYLRTEEGDTTRYYRDESERTNRRIPTPDVSGRVEFADTQVTALDDGRYRIVVEDHLRYQYVDDTPARALDSSLVLVVDERGVVSHVERRATLRADDGTVFRTSEDVTYTDLGSTTVDRPDWLDAAVNATQPVEAR